jgi:hypothetical protein
MLPKLKDKDLWSSIETARTIENTRIHETQIDMAIWFLKHLIPRETLYYVSRTDLVLALGVTEAMLWHIGQKGIACLMTAHEISDNESIFISPSASKSQMDPEVKQELLSLYPYQHFQLTVKDPTKAVNPVIMAIEKIVDNIGNIAWKLTASDEKLEQAFGNTRRRYQTPANIRTDLARAIIAVEHHPLPLV